MIRRLGRKNVLANQAFLTSKAWFDYRFMHPMLRVYYFTHCYQNARIWFSKQLGNKWFGKRVSGNLLEAMPKQYVTAMFTACMLADSYGIPYEFWCQKAMELSIRRGATKPLAPNLMYQLSYIEHIVREFEQRNVAGVYLAKSEAYLYENHTNNIYAGEYQDYLWANVEKKGNVPFFVAQLHRDVRHLSREYAVNKIGEDDFSYALRVF